MFDDFKRAQWRGSYPLGRGVRRLKLRILGLECVQFPHETVVFCIAYLRLIEDVIAVVMVLNLLSEFLDLLSDGFRNHGPFLLVKDVSSSMAF
jgi:hypothetical protein